MCPSNASPHLRVAEHLEGVICGSMGRFHFRLQPALDCARRNEALARRVVVDARLAFDDVCTLLAAVESRISEVRASVRIPAPGCAGGFAAVEATVVALDALLLRRRNEADRASALLERAREVYALASAQRGALERLRERRLLEFNAFAEAAEAAGADDTNGLRANESARSSALDAAPVTQCASAVPAECESLHYEAERTAFRKFTA